LKKKKGNKKKIDIVYNINKNNSFSLLVDDKNKIKDVKKFEIRKIESFYYEKIEKKNEENGKNNNKDNNRDINMKEKEEVNVENKDLKENIIIKDKNIKVINDLLNIEKNYSFKYCLKPKKKEYKIIKNDFINYENKNPKIFSKIEHHKNDSIYYDKTIKKEIKENKENKNDIKEKRIIFEISKNESLYYNKTIDKQITLKEKKQIEISQNYSFYYARNITKKEISLEIYKNEPIYYNKIIKNKKEYIITKKESFIVKKETKKIIFQINSNISFSYDKILKKNNKKGLIIYKNSSVSYEKTIQKNKKKIQYKIIRPIFFSYIRQRTQPLKL
jgi:hypothetical protein